MTHEEQEQHIYLLNEKVLGNNIIIQALADVIIDNGICTEDDLNKRIQKGITSVQEEITKQSEQIISDNNEVKTLIDSGTLLGEA